MRFLADSQQLFRICGYCFHDKNERLPEDRRATVINLIISILPIWYYIVSVEYLFDSRHSVDDRLFALIQIVGYFEIYGAHVTLSFLKSKTSAFFEQFEMVLNQRCQENNKAIDFYLNAEKKTTAIKRYIAICGFCTYDFVLFSSLLNIVIVKIIWEQCQSDPATWYNLLKFNYPFDRHTLFGYFWYFAHEVIFINLFWSTLVILSQFFFGTCLYFFAFCKDFASSFKSIDELSADGVKHENRIALDEKLRNLIDFHVNILNYYDRMNEILNGHLLSIMACSGVLMAISIQQLDTVSGHFDLIFFTNLFITVFSVSFSLPFCYLSTSVFESLKSTDQSIYNTLWYNLPVKHQLYFKLLLVPSCHFQELSAYGFITCSLETFKKMLNTAASIYLMIQSL